MMTPEEFREIRVAAKLTQKEVAAWLGFSHEHVCRMEKGRKNITVRTERLMRFLTK